MIQKQKRTERVVFRITREEKIAMDVKLSQLQATVQDVFGALLAAWLTHSDTELVKVPPSDSQTIAEGDMSMVVALIKEMRHEIGELARRVEGDVRAGKKGGVGADAPEKASVSMHRRGTVR